MAVEQGRVALETDSLHLIPQWASLNSLVLDLLDQYQPALTVKRLGTGLDLDPNLPLSWADRAQLAFGVGRVLGHAVKHSRRGGVILCRTTRDGDWLNLTIGNDGPRLSAERAAVLLGLTDEAEGRGADPDLASAQSIVAAHGGRIELDPASERGAWFVVRLPAITCENDTLAQAVADCQRGRADLVAELSYELRTPLHVVMGYTDLLIEGAFGPLRQEQLDTVRRIDQGARELLAVISGAVDTRALESNRAPLELRHGQLSGLVRGCCQLLADVLGCEVAEAWVWQPATDVYVPVAAYGESGSYEEWLRWARIPHMRAVQLLARANGRGGAVAADARDLFASGNANRHGVVRCLVVPLRRNGSELGLLIAGTRRGTRGFTPGQMQIAQGIGDLAALGLENARLAEELTQAQRLRTELVTSLSHRSRIPLDVIIGYADLLLDDQFGALGSEQVGVLHELRKSGVALLDALNRLLSLTRD